MKMKKFLPLLTAAVCLGTAVYIPAGQVTAESIIDMTDLPTPISGGGNIKRFQRTRPQLISGTVDNVYNRGSRYRRYLGWSEVDGALFYRVYSKAKSEKKYSLLCDTFDTYITAEFYEDTYFKVQAVTYDINDKQYKSLMSNPLKYKAVEIDYPVPCYEAGDLSEDIIQADGGTSVNAYAAADDAADIISGAPAPMNTPTTKAVGFVPAEFNDEEYGHSPETGFKTAAGNPLSTFSADVDTASYTNVRRMINSGKRVPEEAVRTEEFINYFDYSYPAPKEGETVSLYTELAPCPWNDKAYLMMTGVQAECLPAGEEPASNLVFLVDTSGSMSSSDKLELAAESINTLTKTLTSADRVSIITYSGEERVILAGGSGKMVNAVADLTGILEADGVTNGEQGINAAYELAEKYYIEGGNNRIIMMTDGDLNVGLQSEEELAELISEKRASGIYFTVLGYGEGNIKDNKMEALADNGNGSYHYIDIAAEAERVLVQEREQTLFTRAEDVKIQVEFNPLTVKSYRLIGYDNRRLENDDFTDDSRDAGEMGSGQSVTAVYEIIPAKGAAGSLKYTKPAGGSRDLATVKVRYKIPGEGTSKEISAAVGSVPGEMTGRLGRAAAAACFGLALSDSEYKGEASPELALELTEAYTHDEKDNEFAGMIGDYISLYGEIDGEEE